MTHLASTVALPWGLYVHIPFCPYKCDYCDFVAVGGGRLVARWHAPYLAALTAEAGYWAAGLHPDPPVTVFYGGGTPTMLPAADLARLHRDLAARFAVPDAAEVSVECNPGTVDAAGLAVLRAAGINRLSIGLQAAQDRLLTALGRRHTFAEFLEAFGAARAAGFDNLSVDLMYGLPGQSLDDWRESLEGVLEMRPEHVSAYSLQVEEGTPFHARAARGTLALPEEDLVAEELEEARRLCAAAGVEQYEVSNFAVTGRQCRHNLLYWQNADYLGLGIGAHSHWRLGRWANTARLAVYRDGVAAGRGGWVVEREAAEQRRERSETAFLGLRLTEGIDLAAFAARHGMSLDVAFPGARARLLARGLCQQDAGRLRLRPEAIAIGNQAFAAFV